jgi:hypothetical protein
MLFAVVFSLLVHLAALFFLKSRLLQLDNPLPQAIPFTVSLNLPDKPRLPSPPLPLPEPPAEAKPLPKPQPKTVRKPPAPTVIATNKPTPDRVELPPVKPAEPTPLPPTPSPRPDAPTDMMSYVNAARERRRQSEDYAARVNAEAVARERKPSEDEIRNEIIKNNLKAGTNGIFQIISLGPYNAQFSFKGWTTDYYSARRELVQVEAGPGEDIKRNIARKMIELIRRHYSGDFNWESLRLGRVVVLSAREEDQRGLEDFLIQEFFQGDMLR